MGTSPATAEADNFRATESIVLKFDNSLITTSDIDAAGKNKQIMAIITFTYTLDTGVGGVSVTDRGDESGKVYDLQGRKVTGKAKGLVIVNGKKLFMAN